MQDKLTEKKKKKFVFLFFQFSQFFNHKSFKWSLKCSQNNQGFALLYKHFFSNYLPSSLKKVRKKQRKQKSLLKYSTISFFFRILFVTFCFVRESNCRIIKPHKQTKTQKLRNSTRKDNILASTTIYHDECVQCFHWLGLVIGKGFGIVTYMTFLFPVRLSWLVWGGNGLDLKLD